jgi:hypothetical protein
MQDLLAAPKVAKQPGFDVSATTAPNGEVTVRAVVQDTSVRALTLRAENLAVAQPIRPVARGGKRPQVIEWKTRRSAADLRWIAVVIPDGDVSRRREAGAGSAASERIRDR